MAYAHTFQANPHWLPAKAGRAIDHVPGEDGWPIVGNTLKQLADPPGHTRRMAARYGNVYWQRSFGGRVVTLLGADANELVLFDRDKLFSSEQGWGPMLNLLFPRGLMLLDFEKHRVHRRTLSVAFKPEPMRRYSDSLNEGIKRGIADWNDRELRFYPAVKQLTLDLAATSFLGIPWGPEAEKVNQAFVDEVQATVGLVRVPLPGTAMRRGVRAREYLREVFGREVPKRRDGDGEDIFSQICRATKEDGTLLTDDEIVDHMNFLMMAAHDTITSSVTSMVHLLGRHPEWQDKLRAEMIGLGLNSAHVPYERVDELVLTDYAFKEALRLIPPVPSIPRRAVRDFSFGGYDFPAGTFVGVNPAYTHLMPEHWAKPDEFDPMRFTPEAAKGRHKFAWVPFGGGAHMCLGLHFAYLQTKLIMYHLLTTHRIVPAETGEIDWQYWPIPKPKNGLPVRLERLA